VINTLNRCARLERTLVALRDQTYDNFEVIVVNGPSDDGTADMLASFRDRARLATCDEASLGRSRNIGVRMSSADIVAFIDDDAVPRDDWLEVLVLPYRNRAVAAVGGPVFDVPSNDVAWGLCTCTRLGVADPSSEGPLERYLGRGADPVAYLPGCNMSFRRQILVDVGGFNTLLTDTHDDAEICSRLIDRGHRIHVVEDVVVRHDRAPNPVRDGLLEIRDPYPLLFCRTVFASHCYQPVWRDAEIVAAMQSAADEYTGLADHYAAKGTLTRAERDIFVARAHMAVRDGLEEARAGRQTVTFAARSPGSFLPYR
jgi:glycosyltransferase involved in cell wall biosynthesis